MNQTIILYEKWTFKEIYNGYLTSLQIYVEFDNTLFELFSCVYF